MTGKLSESLAALAHERRPTLGVVAKPGDLPDDAFRELFPAGDWRATANMAREQGAYIVAAGRPWKPQAGAFLAIVVDVDMLAGVVMTANARLAEVGASATGWIVAVDEPHRSAILAALAQVAATEGEA